MLLMCSCVATALWLTLSIASRPAEAVVNDSVKFLPGYGLPPSPMAAGRLSVDTDSRGVELFYVFTSALPSAAASYISENSVPIIVWFQGFCWFLLFFVCFY